MKFFELLLVAMVGANIVACSSTSGGAKTPDSTDFSSPSGSLTNSNANEVAQVVFNVFMEIVGSLPGTDEWHINEPGPCNTANSDGTSGSVDMECFWSDATANGCVVSGTVTYSSQEGITTFQNQDVTLSCTGNGEALELISKGEVKMNADSPLPSNLPMPSGTIICANVTNTFDGKVRRSDYCRAYGSISVNVGDGNILCGGPREANADCTKATIQCTDKTGVATVTCDASPSSVTSNCGNPLQTVSNCTVTR